MKLLCCDLDFTLLDSGKRVSEGNYAAIQEMIKKGHHFAIVSGRPLVSALRVAHEYGLDTEGTYIATFNGGQIYDCSKGEVVKEYRMNLSDVEYIFSEAKAAGLHVHTYVDNDSKLLCEKNTPELKMYTEHNKMEAVVADNPLTLLDKDPIKTIVMSVNGRKDLEPFRQSHLGWSEGRLSCLFSCDVILEYENPLVGKGNAVRMLAEHLGVDMADTVAVGDEENDISMMEAAAVGVCMCNGPEHVKPHADYITEHNNDEDGVAEVIYKFILND